MFQLSIMSYVNFRIYVLEEIDNIFCNVRVSVQAYIDDIICRITSFENMFQKLWILFQIFVAFNISIKSIQIFLNNHDVDLLGQRIKSLNLTTTKKRLKVIKELIYLDIFGALKYYLGQTRYFHLFIHFYMQLANCFRSSNFFFWNKHL